MFVNIYIYILNDNFEKYNYMSTDMSINRKTYVQTRHIQ